MSSVTDEIKARVDLVDLVGRTVSLRKSGATSFKGLCPFHQEKTPSFYVFTDSGTWICFGCQKKGSAFDWLMEREHLEFGEALSTLAQMAGVELPARRDPETEERHARLYDLLARAQAFYQGLLHGASGADARRYLAGRGVSEETMAAFGLGYAPGAGNGLLRYLQEHGFSAEEMVEAAVVSVGDDGHPYDFFRDRVLFPIRDLQGRTIAFGGRTLGAGTPKYLNTRDTLLFHKQETLFALDLARKPIGQLRRAVVVEGYMDAIVAHQHGHRNVVATLGTAVTQRHLALLRRLADEIVLALDSDAAGQAATWRTLQVAEQSLVAGAKPVLGPNRRRVQYVPDRAAQLKVLSIPGAKDPDELIRGDPGAWGALVQAAQPVTEFVVAQLPARHDLTSAKGKAEAAAEAAEILVGVANPVEQAHYVQRVAALLHVDEAAVRQMLRSQQRAAARSPRPAQPAPTPAGGAVNGTTLDAALDAPATLPTDTEPTDREDEYALALLVRARAHPGALADGGPAEADFVLPQARAFLRAIQEVRLDDPPPALVATAARVRRCLADVERLHDDQLRRELAEAGLRMRKRSLLARKRHVHDLLREAPDAEERARWAAELSHLARGLDDVEQQLQSAHPALMGAGSRA